MPLQETEDLKKGFYADRGNVSYEDVPAPEDNSRDIEFINAQIMGEQPGTAEYRALQWGKAGLLLSTVQNQLRDQTKELAQAWESPRAKEIFLDKVGMTLAYLDVWHEAATTNSYALTVLAGIMREAQNEMRDLYAEYERAIAHSGTEASLARAYSGKTGGTAGSPVTRARNMHESGPPSTQGDDGSRARMRESMRTADENKANYDVWARELASRVAERYVPVIQRLENGHAKKMTPLNAVNHPGAYGPPMKITNLPPPGGPGAAPNPPGPPPSPDGLEDKLPPPDGLKDKLPSPDGLKDTLPDATDAPKAPDPTALQNLPPTLPGVPIPTMPVPPNLPGAPPPGLSPATLTALANALTTLGPDLRTLTSTGGLTLNASQTTPFTARAPSTPPGLYPPNTITPPPGGVPNQPKAPQGKVLGQRAQQNPPPGAPGRAGDKNSQKKASPGTETPQAFQPPPAPNAPVLGDQKNKRTRPGGAKEAPAAGQPVTPPNATSPVLSNRHRGNGPAKTYGEQRAERRRAQQRRPGQETPEIATGVPTGTAPVLSGRFAPAPETTEAAPITLRGRELTPVARGQHAPPEVHADRTTRAPRQAEPTESVWETENPGGPVVAASAKEKQYRPEPPTALGGR